MNHLATVFVLAGLSAGQLVMPVCRGAGTDSRPPGVATAPYSAEQILNGGVLPGRKPSPRVMETINADGFAKERLYSVPPSGTHPRLLFGPADLPRLRQQLQSTKTGCAVLAALKKQIAGTIDQPGSWENDCFKVLCAGELKSFEAVYAGPKSKIPKGPPGTTKNPLIGALQDKAFLALIEDDAAAGRQVAAATAKLAAYLDPLVLAAAAGPDGDNYWRSIRKVTGDGAAIGYLYDFAQPFMTPEQTAATRQLLVHVTRGRYTFSMDLPSHWRNWNFIGMAIYFPLISLAIEGEEGYDPRIYERGREVARDYVNYSLTPRGIAKEAIGYHTGGMAHLSEFMLAMANRGDNLFINDRFRQQVETWAIWAMQPYGGEWLSCGDLGTFPPAIDFMMPMKFFFPNNPRIDFVYQNLAEIRNPAQIKPYLPLLVTPADAATIAAGAPVDYRHGAAFSLPNTLQEPERGYLFMRDGWSAEATTLQFAARNDVTYASHNHANAGTFYFSALGRAWSLSSFRETETKYQNCIAIDGRGQGYFPTPATWLGVVDSPLATFGAVDLKYCYDWRWAKPPMVFTPEEFAANPRLKEYEEVQRRLASHTATVKWEQDPLPQVIDYYSGFLSGNPLMWDEDSWVRRGPFNPVRRAFRTAGLVRGSHPYAFIMDDIQKDVQERLYEWRMMMPCDVEAVSFHGGDLILGPITDAPRAKGVPPSVHREVGTPLPDRGTPLLLVRILEASQPADPTFSPNPVLESLELLKHDDMHQFYLRSTGMAKRLVLPSRSVAPDYKVLLYPFRQGDKLPVSTWNDARTTLSIEHDGVADVFTFTKADDGRTRLKLARGGQEVAGP